MGEIKKPDLDALCKIEERLIQDFQTEVMKGLYSDDICLSQMGAVSDMIKDMAEAKEKCMKAYYYETVVKTMNDAEHGARYDDEGRMGYDHWRYADGRFAPKGHGHNTRGGYNPMTPYEDGMILPYYMDMHDKNYVMGYHGETPRHMDGSDGTRNTQHPRYGYPYENYMNARRHYTETKDPSHKEMMDSMAMEHISDSMGTIRDIWKNADPTLKKRMKADLTTLVGEMKTE